MCVFVWVRAAYLTWGTVFITNYHTSLSINFLEHLWSFSAHSSARQAQMQASKRASQPASQPNNIHIHWQLEWLLPPHTYLHKYCFTSSFIELVFPFFLCFLSANVGCCCCFSMFISKVCFIYNIYGISDSLHSFSPEEEKHSTCMCLCSRIHCIDYYYIYYDGCV